MMKIYGQSRLFEDFVRKTGSETPEFLRTIDHFVRNRHFSGGPITDKASIFSDVSVNDSDFDKFSAAHYLLNHCT